jgi:hypothetical protein
MKRTASRQSKRSRLNRTAVSNRTRHAARKMTFENMEDRRLLAAVVYDFTVDTPVGFGGTITLDLDFAPDSSNGTIDTYEWGNPALEDFSLSHPSYAGVTFDGTDSVSDFELTMATADDTPLTLFMDVDDAVTGFIFTEAEFNFGTGNGTLAGALAVTGAALTPAAAPETIIPLTGASSTASAENSPPRVAANVTNGSGMTGEGATGVHTGDDPNDGWLAAAGLPNWFRVDLGATYEVEKMYVWNGESNVPTRGVETADIYYSLDVNADASDFSGSEWTLLTSGQDFGQIPGGPQDNNTPDFYGPTDAFDLNVTARVIALNITDVPQTGGSLNELQFTGTELVVPNTAPTIADTVGSQAVDDNLTISPFSGVTIDDADGDSLSVSVTLSDGDTNGVFSAASLTASGFAATVTPGIYTFSAADPAAAQAAIQALVFTPTANQVATGLTVETTFTISVNDQTAPAVTDDTTTVIATAIDVVPPTVTSFALNTEFVDPADLPKGPQPTSWQQQRSDLRSIRVEFSKPIEILPSEVVLTNLGINAPVDADEVISLDPAQVAVAGSTLTIVFGVDELPAGVYQLELIETITSVSGLPLDGDANGVGGDAYTIVGSEANSFTRLTANWNGDSGISVFDFTTFSYWFGLAIPTAPKYADVNDDNAVSVFDFTPFSTSFGEELIFPAAFAALIHDEGSLRAAGVFEESEPAEVIVRAPTGQGWEIEHRDRMTDAIMR